MYKSNKCIKHKLLTFKNVFFQLLKMEIFSENDFIFQDKNREVQSFQSKYSAPSNIALVKYWGKKGNQIPANPSISFTLKNCKTITAISFEKKENNHEFSFDFYFENKPKESFKPKLQTFFERIEKYCPYLKDYQITIHSENTFPHSSGIASSASGMAAMAMNIMALEKELNPTITESYFNKKASFLARLGSGSACRSIDGEIVVWGEHQDFSESSDLYGVSFDKEIHPNFKNFQDTILLVDKGEKQVSSTVGHNLMHNHPFANERFEQAHRNLSKLNTILQNGDIDNFIQLVESEALTLHAMMMTSLPYFILMKPNTLKIINKIWSYRTEMQIPVCFTLDAGANVHVLYPEKDKEKVLQFIDADLAEFCQNRHYICDEVGNGSQKI